MEIVRAVIDAHDRGDFDAVFTTYDPAIEWDVYRGHDGIRAFWRAWFAAWEKATWDYEEFIDAGQRVVSILTQRMRGRTSGVEFEWRSYAQVWVVKRGDRTEDAAV